MIRSHSKWTNQGEKANNYFCNLKSHKYKNKHMPIHTKSDGTKYQGTLDPFINNYMKTNQLNTLV